MDTPQSYPEQNMAPRAHLCPCLEACTGHVICPSSLLCPSLIYFWCCETPGVAARKRSEGLSIGVALPGSLSSLKGSSNPSAPDQQMFVLQCAQSREGKGQVSPNIRHFQGVFPQSNSPCGSRPTLPPLHPRLPASNYPCLQSPASCLPSTPPLPACLI